MEYRNALRKTSCFSVPVGNGTCTNLFCSCCVCVILRRLSIQNVSTGKYKCAINSLLLYIINYHCGCIRNRILYIFKIHPVELQQAYTSPEQRTNFIVERKIHYLKLIFHSIVPTELLNSPRKVNKTLSSTAVLIFRKALAYDVKYYVI